MCIRDSTIDFHPQDGLFYNYPPQEGLNNIFRKILEDFDFGIPYHEKEADIKSLVNVVKKDVLSRYSPTKRQILQVLKPVFYRNKAAYLIGRTYIGNKWMPFIIPLLHGPKGIFVDTLIFDPDIISGIFSFTRSYFMVDIE